MLPAVQQNNTIHSFAFCSRYHMRYHRRRKYGDSNCWGSLKWSYWTLSNLTKAANPITGCLANWSTRKVYCMYVYVCMYVCTFSDKKLRQSTPKYISEHGGAWRTKTKRYSLPFVEFILIRYIYIPSMVALRHSMRRKMYSPLSPCSSLRGRLGDTRSLWVSGWSSGWGGREGEMNIRL